MNTQKDTKDTVTVREFLAATVDEWPRRHAVCADGWTISIQESEAHYSDDGTVEIACEPVEALAEYGGAELSDGWRVYGFVPVSKVQDIVDSHGGIRQPEAAPPETPGAETAWWRDEMRKLRTRLAQWNKQGGGSA